MANSIDLKDFIPQTMLHTDAHIVKKSKFPVIDAHNHLGSRFGHPWADRPVSELLEQMDQLNIEAIIDLDGGFGMDIFKRHMEHFKKQSPSRFIHFGGIDFNEFQKGETIFKRHIHEQLSLQKELGSQGIKIWKNLGLHVKDSEGKLVRVNDSRLSPLWEKASELELPVMIHVADPLAFFNPLDVHNERYEELSSNPDWHFPPEKFPPFNQIIEDFYNMIQNNPSTSFIGAHVGCYAENLDRVSQVLETCPNFFIDTSARLAELGRQPYSSLDFFIEHQDRIVLGTDVGMDQKIYQNNFRFFETKDEYFNYDSEPTPSQGRWSICGIGLPDSILKKIYSQNIKNILKIK